MSKRRIFTDEQLRAAARQYVPEAIAGLRELARNGKTKRVREQAAKALRDRGISEHEPNVPPKARDGGKS
jgi:hypothetical protein